MAFSPVSMWLEFAYTGHKEDSERFEVFLFPYPTSLSPFSRFIEYGADLPRVHPYGGGSPH